MDLEGRRKSTTSASPERGQRETSNFDLTAIEATVLETIDSHSDLGRNARTRPLQRSIPETEGVALRAGPWSPEYPPFQMSWERHANALSYLGWQCAYE